MESKITMGSLFSGSGGFELAGQMSGIIPVWASEILESGCKILKVIQPNIRCGETE